MNLEETKIVQINNKRFRTNVVYFSEEIQEQQFDHLNKPVQQPVQVPAQLIQQKEQEQSILKETIFKYHGHIKTDYKLYFKLAQSSLLDKLKDISQELEFDSKTVLTFKYKELIAEIRGSQPQDVIRCFEEALIKLQRPTAFKKYQYVIVDGQNNEQLQIVYSEQDWEMEQQQEEEQKQEIHQFETNQQIQQDFEEDQIQWHENFWYYYLTLIPFQCFDILLKNKAQTIKTIESYTNCRIWVDRAQASIEISSSNKQNIKLCFEQICQTFLEHIPNWKSLREFSHFVSIPAVSDQNFNRFIQELQQEFQNTYPQYKNLLQKGELLHFTIVMLTLSTNQQRLQAIKCMEEIKEELKQYLPFRLQFQGIGSFGPPHQAKTLYLQPESIKRFNDISQTVIQKFISQDLITKENLERQKIRFEQGYFHQAFHLTILKHDQKGKSGDYSKILEKNRVFPEITLSQIKLNERWTYDKSGYYESLWNLQAWVDELKI